MSKGQTSTKDVVYPEQITFGEDNALRRRTALEKCLVVVAIVLLVIAIVMTILFVVHKVDDDDDDKMKVCTSNNCVATASGLSAKMDASADPCQDFAQYACGNFYKTTLIPDDKTAVFSFSTLTDENKQIIRAFLQEDISKDDPEYLVKIKNYYRACMDEATLEKLGLTPYTDSEEAKDWPTINPSWDEKTFDLNSLIAKYKRRFVEPIFENTVFTNLDDSTRRKLYISQPSLSLPTGYLKLPRNNSIVMALQQYYTDIAMAFGAVESTAKADAAAEVDFEREMANILVTKEDSFDLNSKNNPSTLRNLSRDYPYLDWHRGVQAAFDHINKTIPEDLPVSNQHPKFFQKLGALLQKTDARVIQNRFGFAFASRDVLSLTKEMRKIQQKYLEVLTGQKTEKPRWSNCIDNTVSFFGTAVGKKFVLETFSESSKKYIDTMIVNLKTAFGQLLEEAGWMHPKTKEAAFKKLKSMNRKIGYPDDKFGDKDIAKQYQKFTVFKDQYYKTNANVLLQIKIGSLANLDKPVDKTEWSLPASALNARYDGTNNEVIFPAGILRPPFFSDKYPSSVRYGAIGSTIGHEITHGFDRSGSQFDYKGDLKNWWQENDRTEYDKKTQCVIDYYSNFTLKEINMNVNGKLTAGENTADLGGLKESYRAYKAYAATQEEELPLPGLQLTTDQQFFLSFAQLWCAKYTKPALRTTVLTDVHSPVRFRILGPLQSSEDFARAFKCPLQSPMNPANKCQVW